MIHRTNKDTAFTIIAQNYIGFGVALAVSMKESNPDIDFYIFFSDGMEEDTLGVLEKHDVAGVNIQGLSCADIFLDMAFYYEITEYCTAIKPFLIDELFNAGYQTTCYIDPDIYVYDSLKEHVLSHLHNYNALVTPHLCSPIPDTKLPGEQGHLRSGTYNLGFIAVKNSPVGRDLVTWWMEKCRHHCSNDPFYGLFVDQKWINLVPGMFEDIYISRYLGLNMAYWNLHERTIENDRVNGEMALVFFHFSGFVTNDINCISKYQNRYTLKDRPDLGPLFENYKRCVDQIFQGLPGLPDYKYSEYSDGRAISLIARQFYHWNLEKLANPFSSPQAEEAFLRALKSEGITEARRGSNAAAAPSDINRKAKKINYLMRLLIKLIGPNKYAALCKYFGHLSSLNHQKFLLKQYAHTNVIEDGRNHLRR